MRMKRSIRRQFAVIFIGLMAGCIMLCFLVNTLFLEQYYINSKVKVIHNAYESINAAANSDSYGTDAFIDSLNSVCNQNNITVCVLDADSKKKYASDNGGDRLDMELRLLGYLFGRTMENVKVIKETGEYTLQRVGPIGNEYLEMVGRLNSEISFIMRTPLESIKDSASIANRFFFQVGVFCAIMGGIIIWFVARKITDPILSLSKISERMVHLDFEAKYQGNAHNEIDLLGENINKLSQSLEHSISELKTANNELRKDIERKDRIDEMRREFLSNVSHELKTPIALIQGYAEGLLEEINADSENRQYYCEVIMDEAGKMNELVKKLMSLDKLESGANIVEFERFDIVTLIRNCIQSGEILAVNNEITVTFEDEQPLFVWADEYMTEEVFMNYFSNALHHCQADKVIKIWFEKKAGKVRINVYNSGNLIPEEAIEKVWDKFYKVDKARTREYGGSGVGLSIVKAIMESMNQCYGVENVKDGVLFWFELELVEQA